ncbi:ABC transporter permease [Rhizobium sp. NTR19]|uniref:ABC transporter permease n=1 Tax=Neorhizobium turbinariae TaxID=2937795 RepID=A0ABT0IN45_9HYPH|nr:ABC transporter permease [Neorhizobium turbinariae]MCK8779244.1 ABC transporter permease [Neorhizobium turbinariae]
MTSVVNTPSAVRPRRSRLSKLFHAICHAPGATLCAIVILLMFVYAFVTPLFSQNPFEFAGMSVLDSFIPPMWMEEGMSDFPLGTDDQGRNLLTAMAYGMRTSIFVGILSVVIGLVLGGGLGLIAGFVGGKVDAFIMRVADVQLAYPALLLAMIIDGAARAALGAQRSVTTAITIVVLSIGIAFWVQYARTIRSSVMIERDQDYVSAARITGRSNLSIIVLHILPNVMAPVLVIATINLGIAIITEATLSFLGIGIPVTTPSLGTLIRNGNNFLQSGEWWISVWPCLVLVLFVVSVNILGDHLRDVYNPRLRGRS